MNPLFRVPTNRELIREAFESRKTIATLTAELARLQRVEQELEAVKQERDELREALKPFAEMFQHYVRRNYRDGDTIYQVASGSLPDAGYTLSDLRRAAAALKVGENERQ